MLGGPDVAKAMGNRIIWLLFTVPGVLPGNQNTFLSLIPSRAGFEQLQVVGNKWQVVLDVSTCEIAAEETTAPLVCTDGRPRLLGVMIHADLAAVAKKTRWELETERNRKIYDGASM